MCVLFAFSIYIGYHTTYSGYTQKTQHMTEELIELYKQLYINGGILYRLGRPSQERLAIVFTPPSKNYSQHAFPKYEYSREYAQKLLKSCENK